MLSLFWSTLSALFGMALSALFVAAGLKAYARRRAMLAALQSIDDDAVRTIVDTGALTVEVEEPLDLREIGAEEERFWAEPWDEPEEV